MWGVTAPAHRRDIAPLAGPAAFLVLAALLLWWAKWAPSAARVSELSTSGLWSGESLLAAAGVEQGSAPSLRAGLEVTRLYGLAVWKAVVTGLVLAAAVQALVPRTWLVGLLARRRSTSSAVVAACSPRPR